MSWWRPLWVHLVWDSLWTCVHFSFTRLGKFSVIISSNRFSVPCPLSSSSGTHMMWMLSCFVLSQRCLNYPHFLKFIFLFAALVGYFLLPRLPIQIRSSASFNLLFIPSSVFLFFKFKGILMWVSFISNISLKCNSFYVPPQYISVFFISDIVFFISDWIFFMVSFSCHCSSHEIPWALFITIFLNAIFDQLLASISFSFFFGDFSCSLTWDMFLCLTILAASLWFFSVY